MAASGRSGKSCLPRNLNRTFVYRPLLVHETSCSLSLDRVASIRPGSISTGTAALGRPLGRAEPPLDFCLCATPREGVERFRRTGAFRRLLRAIIGSLAPLHRRLVPSEEAYFFVVSFSCFTTSPLASVWTFSVVFVVCAFFEPAGCLEVLVTWVSVPPLLFFLVVVSTLSWSVVVLMTSPVLVDFSTLVL